MTNKFDRVNSVDLGKKAALSEQTQATNSATKSKMLNKLPTSLESRFDKLRTQGKTTLNFSAFIYEAINEKLNKEEA